MLSLTPKRKGQRKRKLEERAMRLELTTFSMARRRSSQLSYARSA